LNLTRPNRAKKINGWERGESKQLNEKISEGRKTPAIRRNKKATEWKAKSEWGIKKGVHTIL